jgi:Antitoxin ParD
LLQRTLGEERQPDQDAALVELVTLLDARVQRAEKEGVSTRTVDEIFRQARSEMKSGKNG